MIQRALHHHIVVTVFTVAVLQPSFCQARAENGEGRSGENVAPFAAATGSGKNQRAALDGIKHVDGAGEWVGGSPNAWYGWINYPKLELTWKTPRKINTVVLYDRPTAEEQAVPDLEVQPGLPESLPVSEEEAPEQPPLPEEPEEDPIAYELADYGWRGLSGPGAQPGEPPPATAPAEEPEGEVDRDLLRAISPLVDTAQEVEQPATQNRIS